ncbi:MAG: hypothetical protein NC925_05015 [Candidatus Omnitrophica bacterium]|nr:hypothetical protein [Candidatus Omnitrophota bacterium]
MTKEIIKYKNIASSIAILMFLLAIPAGIWPYGYYVLLRWVVTGTALFTLWVAYKLERKTWIGLMAITAILFNPIAPIHLDKETWVIIDFIVAILFLVSMFKIKIYERKN